MDRSRAKKRATMMDSEDEEDDILTDLHQPKLKKKRDEREITDIAEGPRDFIQALTEAGFHPRSGNLPNTLSTITYQSFFIQFVNIHSVY